MKDMFKKFKELNSIDRMLMISTFIIMVLLIGNLIMTIRHIYQFNTIRDSGNDRWFQVEERIITYEKKVDQLEEMIKNLKK